MKITPKILLTSVCRPLGPRYGDGQSVGYELLHGQVTRAQGVFSPRALHLHFALEYIAENLEAPVVVLQYPSRRELIRELRKGYDFVGVSFLLAVFHRMKDVVELIREHSPGSKIILGGYGTVLSDEILSPLADYICREEGVAFMKRLLGESETAKPYRHPLVVSRLKIFSLPVSKTGMIFAGLGCPNGCDFCCTSHFFKRKHVKLLPTGRDIYAVIERYLEIDPKMVFAVLDEDFLLDKKRAMELRECVMKGGRQISMFVFSSVKAISQYKVEEILEMGIDGFWIGYEGTRSGFAKQQGRPVSEIFKEFREHGIVILASMIVGFPYQTRQVVEAELSELMDARPVLSQFLIYGPTPGTPFYDRIMSEDLLHRELADDREAYYKNCTGFTSMVKHPLLTATEIEALQRHCFREDFERLGPSIFRFLENYLWGYRKLKDSPIPAMRKKSRYYLEELRKGLPIFPTGRWMAPNRDIKQWIGRLEREVKEVTGKTTCMDRIRSTSVFFAALWTSFKLKFNLFQHPREARHAYRFPDQSPKLPKFWDRFSRLSLPIQIERRLDHIVWIRLEQWLNHEEIASFFNHVRLAFKQRKDMIVVDLSQLEFPDSEAAHRFFKELSDFKERIRLLIPHEKWNSGILHQTALTFKLYHDLRNSRVSPI